MLELLRSSIVRFYCMDMMDIVWLGLLASCVYLAFCSMFQHKLWWKSIVLVGLVCFLAIVIYVTLMNRSGDHTQIPQLIPFHTYRHVRNGGHPDTYRSNFMNAALFYPAGLLAVTLLPKKWPAWGRCLLVVLLLCAMSAGIEFLQYRFSLGQVEIDDVIHNTLGALTGSAVGLLVPYLFRVIKEKLAGCLSADVKQ